MAIKGSAMKKPQYSQILRIGSSHLFLSLMNQKCANLAYAILGAFCACFVSQITAAKIAISRRNTRLRQQRKMNRFLERQLHRVVYQEMDKHLRRLGSGSEELNVLIRELDSAYSTINSMEQNLRSKEYLIEEMKLHIDSLETQLARANAEDDDVEERSLKEKIDSVGIFIDGSLKDKKDVEDFLQQILTDGTYGSNQTQMNLEDAQNLGMKRES
ncbi:MAR-binding filament-like protein 1-1 isoform X1 [Senna tora]|uniref:MAR-binding filament-like protein 1-1 isoform X1 n=1 Tax=Senna tora TaxID=362788 RepID=A0A834XFG2_9FABA|nr:MAR-binding filament-like protein 1-1 isoform X1 [Senna tora]